MGTFAVATVFALAPAPAGADGPDVIRRWAQEEATVYLAFMWVATVTHLVFLLPFASPLAGILERSDPVLSRLVLIGAAASAVTSTVETAFSASLTLGPAAELADASVTAFWRADSFIFLLVLDAFQALMVGAAGVAVLRYRLMSRWLRPLGLPVAVVLLVDGLWVVDGVFSTPFEVLWLAGLAGFGAWIVGTARWMIRRGAVPG